MAGETGGPTGDNLAHLIFDAFGRGDFAALQALVALDVQVHLPGTNRLAGTYRDLGAVMGMVARATRFFHPQSAKIHRTTTDPDGRIRIHLEIEAESFQGDTGILQVDQVIRLDPEGKIQEVWIEPADPALWDHLLRE